MTDTPLIERLTDTRPRTPFQPWARKQMAEAADRIQTLESEKAVLREALSIIASNSWRDQSRARFVARTALTTTKETEA